MNLDEDFSTWDIQATGGNFAFAQGNTIVSPAVPGTDAHRAVRSTQSALPNATSTVEFIFWSPNATNPSLLPVSGVPPLIYGVGSEAATLNDWVGSDAYGCGYCPGDGKVYINGSVAYTFAPATHGDKIGMTIDTIANELTIRKNDIVLGVVTLTAGQHWFYMATVSGNPDDIALFANSGLLPMYYPAGDNGWSQPVDRIAPILLANEPYMTAATDSPRHEQYDGNLDEEMRQLSINDGVRFWMHGQSAPSTLGSGGMVQLQVYDPKADGKRDHAYIDLLDDSSRGVPVFIGRNLAGAAMTESEPHYAGVLDHCEPDTIKTIQIYVRSMLFRLATPLRRAIYTASVANGTVSGQSRPLGLGIIRNVEGVKIDTLEDALTDCAITAFGVCRSEGVPRTYGADFTITPDGAGVTQSEDKPGKKTYEFTTFGGAFDPDVADYFSGCGNFKTATSNPGPPSSDVGYPIAAGVSWHGDYFHLKGDPFQLRGSGTDKYIESHNDSDGFAWIYQGSIKVRAGYTYTYAINVRTIPYFGRAQPFGGAPGLVDVPPAKIAISWIKGPNAEWVNFDTFDLNKTGLHTGAFVNTTGSDQDLVICFLSNAIISTTEVVQISSIVVNELPPTGQVTDFPGPGLTQMTNELVVKRGPLESHEVNTDDTDAIDAATGYVYGLYVPPTENNNCDTYTKRLFDSSTSAGYGDELGDLRVLRMFKPEDVDDADIEGVLTRSDVYGELIRYDDLAENLTARACGCKNQSPYTDGDFGTSTLSQVPAITRAQLKAEYQFTKTTGVKLANRYRDALLRAPFVTLLDREADIQDFIDHACAPYADERNFYVGDFRMPYGRNFKIGQVWKVRYPIGALRATDEFDTQGGQKLLLLGFTAKQPRQERCRCIFWGL